MQLSIIVPLFNEAENVQLLYRSILSGLDGVSIDYEVLLIDDGSQDATFEISEKLAQMDARIRVIRLRQNYGQTPAIAAGIDYAKGSILLTMDGDLQNDPVDIPRFVEKINEGYDMVVGWRHNRKDKLISRKIPSTVANWLIGKVTGVAIKDNGCTLKAFRTELITQLPIYSDMHRFLPAIASVAGPRIAEIKVRHHPRRHGTSKYGLSRIYKVLLDLLSIKSITSFSGRPLYWFALWALPMTAIGGMFLAFWLYNLLVNSGSTSIVFIGAGVLLLTSAVFLMFLGMIGEVVYRTGNFAVHNLVVLTSAEITPSTETGKLSLVSMSL